MTTKMHTQAKSETESSTMRKLMVRVVPLLAIGAVLQAFSQLNVSFAGLQMTEELGFTSTQFGFGSGIFFLSYLVLGVPANLALLKFGARVWIAFAMFTWGILAAALALTSSPMEFYILRLLLGAAEAGFIPGILFIAGHWFPEEYRGRVLSFLLFCNPIAAMISGPVSGFLLELDGLLGLSGWQWVFIVEGLPASFLAIWVFRSLPARVEETKWFTAEERAWLTSRLAEDHGNQEAPERFSARALIDTRVLVFALVFLGISALPFGLIFFIPKIIESFGATAFQSSLLSALPFATGAILMVVWGHHSDRTGERLYHSLAALGLAVSGALIFLVWGGPIAGLLGLCLTFGGVFSFLPVFWTMPNRLLVGAVAATGIGIINGMGGVSGIIAPTVMGAFKDLTGGYETGLMCVVTTAVASGLLLLIYGRSQNLHRREPAPVGARTPEAAGED